MTELWTERAELMMPHGTLREALDLSIAFNQDESPKKGAYLRQQFTDFTKVVRDLPGYAGVFGTGYPFYAWKGDGGVYEIPEITRYNHSYKERIDQDQLRKYGAWICGACQINTDLPDLKTICKPCGLVDIKPRDVFKALPDLDFWIVTDIDKDERPQFEKEVEVRLEEAQFKPSDKDIGQAVDDTMHVMRTLRRGNLPSSRLPIDLHIVTTRQMRSCLDRIPVSLRPGHQPVLINTRSLHKVWEGSDVPYDFTKDFVFSLTPNDWKDAELSQKLVDTRKKAKKIIGEKAIEIMAAYPKEQRQLERSVLRDCLNDRIESW